jgi:16S rRNA pseudouridine516 synthase
MRLDRYLSSVTELTRSQAQKAVRQGRVTVNGVLVKQSSAAVTDCAEVRLDETEVARPGPRYFMLHKPQDYVCSSDEPAHRSALSLLHERNLKGLHFAGRLDLDTTGLVLITDDGDWSHRIASPRHASPKSYLVSLAEPLSQAQAERLRIGVQLRNEAQPTRPAQLEYLSENRIRLTITEGRYHQVKRMLAAVGNRVVGLHRESVAGIALDPSLRQGEYRALSAAEIAMAGRLTG